MPFREWRGTLVLTRLRRTVGALSSVEHSGSVVLRLSSALVEMDGDRRWRALPDERVRLQSGSLGRCPARSRERRGKRRHFIVAKNNDTKGRS